ncbi:hypothetical protein PAYE108092_15105 [Paracoccus yeei]
MEQLVQFLKNRHLVGILGDCLLHADDRAGAGHDAMGAGQFCTNPGIAVVLEGEHADSFTQSARAALERTGAQVMLTEGIARAYREGQARFEARNAVTPVLSTESEGRMARPNLYETTAEAYLQDHALGEEVFGPLGLVVRVRDPEEMAALARGFEGQLTATIHMEDADLAAAQALLPILERKAGRVLVNGFPTGVEVCDAMVHGGPDRAAGAHGLDRRPTDLGDQAPPLSGPVLPQAAPHDTQAQIPGQKGRRRGGAAAWIGAER